MDDQSLSTYQRALESLWRKFTNEETWLAFGEGTIKITLTILVAWFIVKVGKIAIRNFFALRSKAPLTFSERRENTLLKLIENVLAYVVYFIALVNILGVLTFDVKGLIAGAGVLGLAIGFGAQSLVKDVITGFFIIFEDQFSVGDFVRIGQFEGTVEEIGLRTTKLKVWTGEIHILPNGSIIEVTNFSLHNSVAVVDISIAYEENVEKAEKVINELLETLKDKYPEIVDTPKLLGIQMLGPSDVTLRITAETTPMNHWYVARMMRKDIKECLDANGIEIPYPRMVMYSRTEQEAQAGSKQAKSGGTA
ncbi:mechanosensitive ion channel family protein [Domibacillus sp. DTU_2020_1001157_1_SI_ALB_TIR_016]|uniref:mechanosensitive ion channel family protein n=1 Tax=Domibacillus sp. DTU_2020_1001157_1_SI_ALB_TIR_016 TaxID=3077789 RepID=UPI0028ED971D|nr:mechanosensitive ion channel family protein [Domibacillus sp. DTU_2020_1001157_1_SI_ALB_TIR_016]WNS80858.1 mechanosensitive ion channel family protein [Domibacillus sp. DTU_2020_1001157_1_SI_ALB_TIR_016]